jgi:arabinofuranosyltransferase
MRRSPSPEPVPAALTPATSLNRPGIERFVGELKIAAVLGGSRKGQLAFALVVTAFLIYAALFIYRTSFVVGGERYFSLFDDAMISMRYAKNLAHGYGLVWNPGGDRVEGYTNPLWVLFMSIVHFLPIAPSKTSLFIQIAAAAFLAANLYFVRKIALTVSDGSEGVSLGAVLLTASYLPINNWGLQGMEVSVLVLIMSIASWWALTCLRDGRFSFPLYILLGFSTWVRPDMIVPFGGIMLFLAVADSSNRKRHLLWGSLILLGFCSAQTAFRVWYFGDPLPNTYYLKLTGYPLMLRITAGIYVLAQFIWNANILLFVLPFMLGLSGDRRVLLLLWLLGIQMLYSVYVGGDAWEYWGGSNRYISIAMPGFFILLACGLSRLSRLITDGFKPGPVLAGLQAVQWRPAVFPILIGISVLCLNSIHGVGALAELLLVRAPLHSGAGGENESEVREALALRRVTTPAASMTLARAGTIPYFSDRIGIDLLGKNDTHIAHEPMRRSSSGLRALIEFRPGHMKYDYAYSIGERRPDLVVQLWQHPKDVQPYLAKYYEAIRIEGWCIYVRQGSANILWDKLPSQTCQ